MLLLLHTRLITHFNHMWYVNISINCKIAHKRLKSQIRASYFNFCFDKKRNRFYNALRSLKTTSKSVLHLLGINIRLCLKIAKKYLKSQIKAYVFLTITSIHDVITHGIIMVWNLKIIEHKHILSI